MEDALFPITRTGVLEDAWFTLSYSPVWDESGAVAGVFLTIFETTRHHQAEHALRQSEEQFRLLAAASSDVVYSMSADWRQMKTLTSKGFLRDTESSQSTWLETYIPQEDQTAVWQAIQEAIENNKPFELEHRVVQTDGSIGWVVSRARPVLNEKGNISEWFGNANDITPRKRAEEALRAADERYRTMADSAPVLIWETDESGATFTNGHYTDFFGVPFEEIRNMGWAKFLHPDDVEGYIGAYQQAFERRESYSYECRCLRADGEYRWLLSTGHPLGGNRFVGFSADITESKRRELNAALLGEIGQDLSLLSIADEILEAVGARLGQFLQLSGCYFVDVDEDKGEVTVHYGWARKNVPSLRQTFQLGEYLSEEFMRTMRAGDVFIMRDTAHDERAEAQNYAKIEVGSFVTVPFLRNGRYISHIAVTSQEPHDWRPDEIALLQEIANRVFPRIERARAEAALRTSEEKYRTLFDSIDEAFFIIEVIYNEADEAVDYRLLEANPAFERATGIKNAIGKLGSECSPDSERYWVESFDRVARTGESLRFENYHAETDRWYQCYYTRNGGVGSRQIAAVFDDITERKQQEQQQTFLLGLSDTLRDLRDPVEIQRAATRMLGEGLEASRVFYVIIDKDGDTADVFGDYTNGVPSRVGRYSLSAFSTYALGEWRAGRIASTSDVNTDPRYSVTEREAYASVSTRAGVGIPLIKEGRLVAILGVNQSAPRHWTDHDTGLAREVAERTWAAVERARAEDALRESRSRLESIANLVPDLLWDSEPDGSTNWYNQRWLQYTGQSLEEAIGWGWVDAIHPDDREASVRRYRESVRNGEILRQEHRIRRSDGEYRWFVVTAYPFKDESGQVIKMYGAATDMHEARLMHEALREREAELARVQRIGGVGGVDINVAAGMTGERSPEYRRLHGLSPETTQEMHEDWLARVHPDDREHAETTLREALAGTDNRYESEYRILRPNDGQERWISARLTIERNQSGQPVRLVGVHIDITQRKHTENALRESQERLNLTIDTAQLGVCDWDYQAGIMRGNANRFRLFGLKPEQKTITTQQFLEEIYPDDREATWKSITSQLSEKGEYQVEYRIKRPDDGVRFIAEAGRVMEWKNSQPAQITSILSDVTEQREAQEVLQRSNEALSLTLEQHLASDAVRTELMRRIVNTQEEERGRVSRELHDNLGQHLTAVMLGLHALEGQLKFLTGDKRQAQVPEIGKLRFLVDGLMRAAHDQARQLRPAELDAMGLDAALQRYVEDWSERTGLDVDFQTVNWNERLPMERESTFYRVAQEALTNVVRHAGASFVSVVLQQDQSKATLTVEDDGRGFDTEQTTNRLGMLGMKERVELVGGTLEVESIPDEGTAIIARIPL